MAMKFKLNGKLFKLVFRARKQIAYWMFVLGADTLGRLVFPQLTGGAIGFGVFKNHSGVHLNVSGVSTGTVVSIRSIAVSDNTGETQLGTDDVAAANVNLTAQKKCTVTVNGLDFRELNDKLANRSGDFFFTIPEYGPDAESNLQVKVANVTFKMCAIGGEEWDNVKQFSVSGPGGLISEGTGGS